MPEPALPPHLDSAPVDLRVFWYVNFGANLSWWDRLHGTYHAPVPAPTRLGVRVGGTGLTRLLLPPSPA